MGLELLVAYVLAALVVGAVVFRKTWFWLKKAEEVFPAPTLTSVLLWSLTAFFTALLLEALVMYPFWGKSSMLLALAVAVGPVEEGAKLLPFVASREDLPLRWHLTVRTALAFGVIEAILYLVFLTSTGNLLGAFFRTVVIMFHVAWTALALKDALEGSLAGGYLKASLIHGLYDAPVFLLLMNRTLAGVAAIAAIFALLYLNGAVDEAFRTAIAHALPKRESNGTDEGQEREGEEENTELTSSP